MAFSVKPIALRCSRCGKFVDWQESRLQVICGCRPHLDLPPVLTREATEEDRRDALVLFSQDFGLNRVIAFGEMIALETLDMIVAEMEEGLAGALAWRRLDDQFHIVAVGTDPMWQRAGVGGHLVAEAELRAMRDGMTRVVVSTTNDNLPALYFFQRRGYRLVELRPGSVAEHPEAPKGPGFADIPVSDELRLEKRFVPEASAGQATG
jgi:ribosomal protein S18 acetylase RimI-like enzyme